MAIFATNTTLCELTPSMYRRLTRVERKFADRHFTYYLAQINAGNASYLAKDERQAAKRAYSRANVNLISISQLYGMSVGVLLSFGFDTHRLDLLIPGFLLLMPVVVYLGFAIRRGKQIDQYFRNETLA